MRSRIFLQAAMLASVCVCLGCSALEEQGGGTAGTGLNFSADAVRNRPRSKLEVRGVLFDHRGQSLPGLRISITSTTGMAADISGELGHFSLSIRAQAGDILDINVLAADGSHSTKLEIPSGAESLNLLVTVEPLGRLSVEQTEGIE